MKRERNYDLTNPLHIARFVARERHVFPGGYEFYVVTTDGGLICSSCVRENYYNILHSTKYNFYDGWEVSRITSDVELEDDYCSHCGKQANE